MACTVSIGLVMTSPNTGSVAEAVSTTSNENTTKLIGSPIRLPSLSCWKDLA